MEYSTPTYSYKKYTIAGYTIMRQRGLWLNAVQYLHSSMNK